LEIGQRVNGEDRRLEIGDKVHHKKIAGIKRVKSVHRFPFAPLRIDKVHNLENVLIPNLTENLGSGL